MTMSIHLSSQGSQGGQKHSDEYLVIHQDPFRLLQSVCGGR